MGGISIIDFAVDTAAANTATAKTVMLSSLEVFGPGIDPTSSFVAFGLNSGSANNRYKNGLRVGIYPGIV